MNAPRRVPSEETSDQQAECGSGGIQTLAQVTTIPGVREANEETSDRKVEGGPGGIQNLAQVTTFADVQEG